MWRADARVEMSSQSMGRGAHSEMNKCKLNKSAPCRKGLGGERKWNKVLNERDVL